MNQVTLAMIVRDAEHELGPCLDSVMPHITGWCVIDTGSRDGTRELVKERLADLPGRLHKRKWRSFRENRNELLALAAKQAGGGYLLTIDADCTMVHPGPLPALTGYCYGARVQGKYSHSIPFLLRAGEPWEWRGVAHCHLERDGGYSMVDLAGLELIDRGHPTPGKIERDLELLSAEHAANPLDARTVFYLAQTYWDLGNWAAAAHFYRLRAHMGGFAEEAFFARYRLGYILCEHFDAKDGIAELLAAWRMRPTRAEPLRAIANVATNVATKMAEPAGDVLFVTRSAYGAPPPVPNRWDVWRATYDILGFDEHRAMYDSVAADTDDSQARADADALAALLAQIGGTVAVVELGGWDGALAADMLERSGDIIGWDNYEISAAAANASVCKDPRYGAHALTDWYWKTDRQADVFVASHVIEHLTLADVRRTLDATDCRYVFLQAPLDEQPTDWTGYDGGHILEVGWAGLNAELASRGFTELEQLRRDTVRCYAKETV